MTIILSGLRKFCVFMKLNVHDGKGAQSTFYEENHV